MANTTTEVTMIVDQKMIDEAVAKQVAEFKDEINKRDTKIKRLEKKIKDREDIVAHAAEVVGKLEKFTTELVDDLDMIGWFDRA